MSLYALNGSCASVIEDRAHHSFTTTQATMVVSGEVAAKENTRDVALKANGIPTDIDISAKVQKVPPGVSLMGGANTEAKPAEAAGRVLSLKLRRAAKLRTIPILDGSRTLSLLTADDQPYAGGFHFVDEKKNAFSPRKISLYDKDEKVVAMCLQTKAVNIGGAQHYNIYGIYPMYEGMPSHTVDGIPGPAYKWMELEGIHKNPYYEIKSYMNHKPFDPLCLKGTHKQVMSGMDKGVLITSLKHEDHLIAKLFHKALISNDLSEGDVTGWNLTIAPGVDPLAIACVTAVLDHLEGQNI